MKIASEPGNRSFANAYPESTESASVAAVAPALTSRLFLKKT